jgi:hypothetical protein
MVWPTFSRDLDRRNRTAIIKFWTHLHDWTPSGSFLMPKLCTSPMRRYSSFPSGYFGASGVYGAISGTANQRLILLECSLILATLHLVNMDMPQLPAASPSRGILTHNLEDAVSRTIKPDFVQQVTHRTRDRWCALVDRKHTNLYTRPNPSLHTTLGVQASHPFTVHIPLPPHHRPQRFFCFASHTPYTLLSPAFSGFGFITFLFPWGFEIPAEGAVWHAEPICSCGVRHYVAFGVSDFLELLVQHEDGRIGEIGKEEGGRPL